jgi:hypothetical protein
VHEGERTWLDGEAMTARSALGLLLAGTLTSLAAAAVGAAFVGPLVRRAFGAPHDYASDYTSPPALVQALLVQAATFLAAFFLAGWVWSKWVRDCSWKTALWAANPLTVGLAFLVLMLCLDGANVPDGELTWEYIGTAMWGIQLCLAVPLYASAFILGARIGRRSPGHDIRSRKLGAAQQ